MRFPKFYKKIHDKKNKRIFLRIFLKLKIQGSLYLMILS